MKNFARSSFAALLTASGLAQAADFKLGFIYAEDGRKSGPMCISEALVTAHNIKFKKEKIEIFKYESQGQVVSVFAAAEKAARDRLDFLIGTRTSQEAITTANILNKEKIPFLATMASHPDVTKDKPFAMRLLSTSNRYSLMISGYIAGRFRPRKVAVIKNISYPYSIFYAEETSKNLKALNADVQIKTFEIIENYSAYKALVTNINDWGADLIYMPLYEVESNAVLAAFAGTKNKLIAVSNGGLSGDRKFFYKFTHENPNVTLAFHDIWPGYARGRHKNEFAALAKEYCPNFSSDLETTLAFDAAKIFLLTFEQHPQLRGEKLMAEIRKTKYDGVSGKVFYGKDGEPVRDMPMISIKDGKDLKLEILNPR